LSAPVAQRKGFARRRLGFATLGSFIVNVASNTFAFTGLLQDEMGVYSEDKQGQPRFTIFNTSTLFTIPSCTLA